MTTEELDFGLEDFDEEDLLLDVDVDVTGDLGHMRADPFLELAVGAEDNYVAAEKRKRTTTVLRRPFGDHIVAVMENADVRTNELYDVLCEDLRYYIGKVIHITNDSCIEIHFPQWGKKYDYLGDANELYIRPYGENSIPAGLNVASNRYTPVKSKIVHAKASSNKEETRSRKATRYGDDFLARPYLPRKRRSLNNDLVADVGECKQITYCKDERNTPVTVEGDMAYSCGREDDLRIQKSQTSFKMDDDDKINYHIDDSRLRNVLNSRRSSSGSSTTSSLRCELLIGAFIDSSREKRASFLFFTCPPEQLMAFEGSCVATSVVLHENMISIVTDATVASIKVDEISGHYPLSHRDPIETIRDIQTIVLTPMNPIKVCAEIYRATDVIFIVFVFSVCIDLIGNMSKMQKKRLDSICKTMRWAGEDWEVYDDIRLFAGRNKYQSTSMLPDNCQPVKNIFDLLSRLNPPNMENQRVNTLSSVGGSKGLPLEIWSEIFQLLDKLSLMSAACCCKSFRFAADTVFPGLKLKLFAHQVNSIHWMMAKERGKLEVENVSWKYYKMADVSLNFVTGELISGSPPVYPSLRGGLLCDEPGLGKTITFIGLILKRLGCVATFHESHSTCFIQSPTTSTSYSFRESESRKRRLHEVVAIPSAATLIVVPSVLREQWSNQIFKHVHSNVLNAKNVFIDDREDEPLPPAEELSKYFVILTTHKRLASEWRKSRPKLRDELYYFDDLTDETGKGISVSPLLGIVFYRVAFDEGHQMGRGYLSESLFMASTILTKCSWLLTGTPTPSDSSQTLSYLYNQFVFLKHPIFSTRKVSKQELWRVLFNKTFSDGPKSHFFSSLQILTRLLSENLIRHSKQCILNIPKPIYKVTRLVLSSEEISVYNTLVAIVRSNLVLTGLDYRNPGALHPDSLLNPINRKALREALLNLRISTAGAGSASLVLPKRDEVMKKIASALNHLENKEDILRKLQIFVETITKGEWLECQRCKEKFALLIFTPCCHTFCPDCLNITKDYCCCCNRPFDWDMTQTIQPGFSSSQFIFSSDTSTTNSINVENLPEDTIWRPRTASTMNSDFELHSATSLSSSSFAAGDEECVRSSKISYLMSSIKKICGLGSRLMRSPHKVIDDSDSLGLPPKIIVFSQFSSFLDRLVIELKANDIEFCDIAAGSEAVRSKALQRFQIVTSASVLLLSNNGSRGLDLSFVTHIFMMDSLVDKSLEQQVVSRAYRMGAKQNVVVEFIYSGDTIDELIYKYNTKGRIGTEFDHIGKNQLTRSQSDTNFSPSIRPSSKNSRPDDENKLEDSLDYLLSDGGLNVRLLKMVSFVRNFR